MTRLEDDYFFTEAELADLIRVKPGTLERWRATQQGPPYVKFGRIIRYARSDVAAWVQSGRVTG